MMLKMKLPGRTAEDGGGSAAEDGQHLADGGPRIPGSVPHTPPNRSEDAARRLGCPLLQLDKEAVFEWFGLHLSPARRIEFMCGLLHMCQPLELRFLGSCLEDLARKDFHVLRDFEIRANNPGELGLLADIGDPVVRSKLLVSLSLLGSENRECAGILFRILSHVDAALGWKNRSFPLPSCRDSPHFQVGGAAEPCCGPRLEAGYGPLEQLSLLFTMASLHPAFPFHQRETIRVQLEKVEKVMEEERRERQRGASARNKPAKRDYLSPSAETRLNDRPQSPRAGQTPVRTFQKEAVYIEKIFLKGISRSRAEREYSFVVKWSNSTSSNVTKTHLELENFLLKLPKEQTVESFEKGILRLLTQGDKLDGSDLERTLREKFLSAPPAFQQSGKVCRFFLSDSSVPSCSHCTPGPPGKPSKPSEHLTEDVSEASSLEEDMEPFILGHRKKPGTKSPNLGLQSAKSPQVETWRPPHSELNGMADWRRKNSALKSSPELGGGGLQKHPADEKWITQSGSKKPMRLPAADREKPKKTDGRVAVVSNGVVRPVPPQLMRQLGGKGLGPDAYGETSSESYSSPSSPQHDGRESLESEDEKDRETDSNSDDSSKGKVDSFLAPKPVGGAAVATVRPMAQREGLSRLENTAIPPEFPQLPFMQPTAYMVQNGTVRGEKADSKVASSAMVMLPAAFREPLSSGSTTGDVHLMANPSHLSMPPPTSPAIQPLVQRFKTAPALPISEGGGATAIHQPPMGAISVIPPSPAYVSPLQPAYPGTDPAPGILASATEPHTKAPGPSLPSALPSPYSLPTPTSAMAPSSAAPATGQAPAVASPVVPTHVPGPAPTPSPALTHSTAQSDSTSYINSPGCSSSGGPAPQQQPGPLQPMGCGACGCRGSCGTIHAPTYCYPPQVARQVFSVQPFLHLTSLCSNSYLSQGAQSGGATQLPFFPTGPTPYAGGPLLHTPSDPVLGAQASYSLQHMAAFSRFYQPLFPSVGVVPAVKKGGNASCYNCGVSGHYAQDCKQPSIDAAQQGGFRLKIVAPPSSEGLDKGD